MTDDEINKIAQKVSELVDQRLAKEMEKKD